MQHLCKISGILDLVRRLSHLNVRSKCSKSNDTLPIGDKD